MKTKNAIIIGAGPGGLTAAYEFLDRTDIVPVVLEMTGEIGGISKTVAYKGNRIDIGGHRFFSKSDRVMQWWLNLYPLQGAPARDDRLLGRQVPLARQGRTRPLRSSATLEVQSPDPETTDRVMLVRSRLSRIFFLGKFFNYPIRLSLETLASLGARRIAGIGLSYLKACLAPIRPERSLEDFLVNRFGRVLYQTFFKDYTEKVWGIPCQEIEPAWGAQRIKGLSITGTLLHAARKLWIAEEDLAQKKTETSLIESFLYPKLGPGQLWETVAEQVGANGGEVHLGVRVVGLETEGDRVVAVRAVDRQGKELSFAADYVISTMPVRELVEALGAAVPAPVRQVAAGLRYRDFMTVGLLLDRLKIENRTGQPTLNDLIPDNWIYIQERQVKLGRLQIFNNWSPYLVADPEKVWLGLEYFCSEGDELWTMPDREFIRFAIGELASIGIIDAADVLDATLLRMPKAYPAYFGTYGQFQTIRDYTDGFRNLFLVGRNGMHRYNNADHSMLTAMTAVENIVEGRTDKENIWQVNAEYEYHEERRGD